MPPTNKPAEDWFAAAVKALDDGGADDALLAATELAEAAAGRRACRRGRVRADAGAAAAT